MLVIYYCCYCYIIITATTIIIITTCTVLGFIFYSVYFKTKTVIPLTEYVYLQGIHLYQSKSLLAASVVNRELGNMVSGVWSRFISAQSNSPSFSHENFILHNTDCIDEISVPVRASGHHLDSVSNIHIDTIKPAVSWNPFRDCSGSEASSFKQSQSYKNRVGKSVIVGSLCFCSTLLLELSSSFQRTDYFSSSIEWCPLSWYIEQFCCKRSQMKTYREVNAFQSKRKDLETEGKKQCSSLAEGQNSF